MFNLLQNALGYKVQHCSGPHSVARRISEPIGRQIRSRQELESLFHTLNRSLSLHQVVSVDVISGLIGGVWSSLFYRSLIFSIYLAYP